MPILDQRTLTDLTAQLVATYVLHHDLPMADLPVLIDRVGSSLAALSAPPAPVKSEPAVDVRHSVTDAALICLACGGKFRTLKRHLRLAHGMSHADYRNAYDLPFNYPIIAPAYTKLRSDIARTTGLGRIPPSSKPRRRTAR